MGKSVGIKGILVIVRGVCLESFVIHRMREEGWRGGFFVVLGLDGISREVGRSASNT